MSPSLLANAVEPHRSERDFPAPPAGAPPARFRILVFTSLFPTPLDPLMAAYNLQQVKALSRFCEARVLAPVQWFPVQRWHGAGPGRLPWRTDVEGLTTWHPRFVLTPAIGGDL